jgi:diguanylate cyclase (GGDEF)-like protein/PAS domain S-box-containing protein
MARPAFDNAFHKAIVDNLHDGVYYVDRDRRITYWNHGAERISGYPAAEVVGRGCRDGILCHTDDTGRVLCHGACPVARTLADGRPREAHVYLRHREGARVPVAVRVAPIADGSGAIVGAVEIFGDDRERQVTEARLEELRRLAVLDPVTGVGNRRWVEMTVRARLDDLERYGHGFGVLFVDVDRFKDVNDRHGHEVGDAVLRAVAVTTSAAVRGTDSVGRWGGDEFVAVCPAADAEGLRLAGERVRALVAAARVPAGEAAIVPTVSVGGAVARRDDDLGSLLARADDAMYRSKQGGRDAVTVDEPAPEDEPAGAGGSTAGGDEAAAGGRPGVGAERRQAT